MTLKLLIDVNLSPQWVASLRNRGFESIHWSTVGPCNAFDEQILAWAREHGYIVFTHDLDFGTLLALTRAAGPSVIQVRAQDVMPTHLIDLIASVLDAHASELEAGALVVVDEKRLRVRILPLS